jgi:hypothetical protein
VFAPTNVPEGSQLYVCPFGPDATNTVVFPVQILTEGLAVTEAVEILIDTMSESEQPLLSVINRVYVVFAEGHTLTVDPVKLPGCHV